MTNQRRILGILWYELVTNVEVAILSQLLSINEAISRRRLSLATSDVWIKLHLPIKPHISESRHDRAQDSLAPGGDNQVVRKNAAWSRSPRAHGSLLLMLGILRRIGQHGGRYNPSTVKRRHTHTHTHTHRERERERERERSSFQYASLVSGIDSRLLSVNPAGPALISPTMPHPVLLVALPTSVPSTHHFHHPSPLHSFTAGLKLSFFANLSHHSLPCLLPD